MAGLIFLLIIIAVSVYGILKPLPRGISVENGPYPVTGVEFIYDLTFQKDGKTVREQQIFDRIYELIDEAEQFIIIDMFLFNDDYDRKTSYPGLSSRLTEALAAKKEENPDIEITFITDEINTFYGSYPSEHLEKLKEYGIRVTMTDLTRLRDPNPVFSGFWRTAVRWFGTAGQGWLANAFSPDSPDVTLRSYLRLLNFKANHRKVVVTEKKALVTSANPHDASGYHSNIAFVVEGGIIPEIAASEKAVADFSGNGDAISKKAIVQTGEKKDNGSKSTAGNMQVSLLTEGKIRKHILDTIKEAGPGDIIWMGMFYLSERDIIRELIVASGRGAQVKLVLDPNKDAFGMEKNGVPNRPVANEMVTESEGEIKVRWYDTRGEQYHSKFVMVKGRETSVIYGGSANLTRRNIMDFNLETDLKIVAPNDSELVREINGYFERIWNNEGGNYTVDYEKYRDRSSFRKVLYRFQEWSGLCSF